MLWGVSTSAYQIEGAPENDWTEWERAGRLKDRRTRCGRATGHRERWRSDLALLPTIGASAYRYSIEWSRVEPRAGEHDPAELARLAEQAGVLETLGIEPVVTLHHYTHPLWFWRQGGWGNPKSVEWFGRLAATLAQALPSVRFWVTLNEPIVFVLGGYLGGLIPPGERRFSAAAAALQNLLRAHAAASAAIRQRIAGAQVGMAHNMLDFAPDRPGSSWDRRLVAAAEALYNLSLVEAIATGRMRWSFPGEGSTSFEIPELPAVTDFFGLNYYSRVHLRFRGLPGRVGEFFYRDRDGRGLTDTGWEIHPKGFDRVLGLAAKAGLPILVTENGIATRDDGLRRAFLREHAVILSHRRSAGTRVEGYFYWSLLDNFRMAGGFWTPLRALRSGLCHSSAPPAAVRGPLCLPRPVLREGASGQKRCDSQSVNGCAIFRRFSIVTNSRTPQPRATSRVRSKPQPTSAGACESEENVTGTPAATSLPSKRGSG